MRFTTPIALALTAVEADAWNSMGPMFLPGPGMQSSSRILKRQRELANRMFEQTDMLMRKQREQGCGYLKPRCQVIDDEKLFQLSIDVPGVKPDDMSISLEDGYLTVRGQRISADENSQFSSKFSQTFSLDPAVDVDSFQANLENGVLTISAPKDMKKLEENIRRIPITMEKTDKQEIATEVSSKNQEEVSKAEDHVDGNELEITEDTEDSPAENTD